MKLKQLLGGAGLSAIAVSLAFSLPVLAADIVTPSPSSPNVVIGSQESHKNLYTAGANVTVNGNVSGDLTAAGGMVSVTGQVEQEVLLAGGTLDVSGPVGNNARLAGGNITINAPIGGDLVVSGGNINLTGKASVGGDLIIAGGNIIVDAPVKGDIRVAAGNLTINSKVEGRVYTRAQRLTFGPQAEVLQDISYKGSEPAVVSGGAKTGQINYTQIKSEGYGKRFAALISLAFLVKLLAWILAAFVLLKFKKQTVYSLTEEFRAKPWENLGWGLGAFIGLPILVILLFITFVGYYLALVLGVTYLLILLLAHLLSAMIVGYLILARLNKPGELPVDWQAILIGVVVWSILRFIPVLGWLVMGVIFLMVLGAMSKKVSRRMSQN